MTNKLNMIQTCNMAFFKNDCLRVNGFNEDFIGWGREDSDFAAKLLHSGVKRRDLKFKGIGYHIHHEGNSREMLQRNHQIYLDTLKNNRSKPRIPFGSLVELGIIKPGTTIFDNKKKISAKIMADGSIKHAQTEGSIHKVAATILGAESCNGWTYWHYNLDGAAVPIDQLRQRLISNY